MIYIVKGFSVVNEAVVDVFLEFSSFFYDSMDVDNLVSGSSAFSKSGALGRPRGMVCGGRREEGSGWGTHVYLWRIHFDIWQN